MSDENEQPDENEQSDRNDVADEHDQSDDRFSGANAAMAGFAVVAVMVLVAVLAIGGREDTVISGDGADTTPTTAGAASDEPATTSPPVTEPVSDSPLAGLPELDVRGRYPLVRVVERDGEPLPATRDLREGRISLSIADGVVIDATTEGCEETTKDAPAWVLQSCNPDPSADGPQVLGTLRAAEGGEGLVLEVPDGGDTYYQGMAVVVGDATVVASLRGDRAITGADLADGDVVRLWVADGCRESSPVQCDVQAIVVD